MFCFCFRQLNKINKQIIWSDRIYSLKYQIYTTSGCQNLGIIKFQWTKHNFFKNFQVINLRHKFMNFKPASAMEVIKFC